MQEIFTSCNAETDLFVGSCRTVCGCGDLGGALADSVRDCGGLFVADLTPLRSWTSSHPRTDFCA